jgi:hypothetical protein
MGLYLEHKKRWNGWNGEIKENNTLELDENDLEKSQKLLDEYINEHSLEDGIIIKLNELINLKDDVDKGEKELEEKKKIVKDLENKIKERKNGKE